jgi:hypothetical protein
LRGAAALFSLGVLSGVDADGAIAVAVPDTIDSRTCPIVDTSIQKIGQQEHRASVLYDSPSGQEQTDQSWVERESRPRGEHEIPARPRGRSGR